MQSNEFGTLRLDIAFPLADGRTLVRGPLAYNQDGLATCHNADFMRERFAAAYKVGAENAPPGVRIHWRVHTALWCATKASHLAGDFVECGVHTGILLGAVMTWLDFGALASRKFFLFDTWAGIPADQISEGEKMSGVRERNRKYQNGDRIYADALTKFSRWPNAVLVRGRVPETLQALNESRGIAYISMDLNVAAAEMAAIEILWQKLLSGGTLLLDDYGWAPHMHQKAVWDAWRNARALEYCPFRPARA